MSLRKIFVALAARGHVTAGGNPYVASAVQAMLGSGTISCINSSSFGPISTFNRVTPCMCVGGHCEVKKDGSESPRIQISYLSCPMKRKCLHRGHKQTSRRTLG
jgi:hypothetical protein